MRGWVGAVCSVSVQWEVPNATKVKVNVDALDEGKIEVGAS